MQNTLLISYAYGIDRVSEGVMDNRGLKLRRIVERNCETESTPVLSAEEIDDLVEIGLTGGAAYMIYQGWLLKQAKAVSMYSISDNGQSLHRSDVYEHCKEMVNQAKMQCAGSAVIGGSYADE